MITFETLFWVFVALFGIVGAMRGWAQEMLVTISVFLGMYLIHLFGILPFIRDFLTSGYYAENGAIIPIDERTYWIRTSLILLIAFFGYQTPRRVSRIAQATKPSERLQDTILGILVGAFNGYMIYGLLWFFLIQFNYQLDGVSPHVQTAQQIIEVLPPEWLAGNAILLPIGLSLAFIIIVFI